MSQFQNQYLKALWTTWGARVPRPEIHEGYKFFWERCYNALGRGGLPLPVVGHLAKMAWMQRGQVKATDYLEEVYEEFTKEGLIPEPEAGADHWAYITDCHAELTGAGLDSQLAGTLCSMRWEETHPGENSKAGPRFADDTARALSDGRYTMGDIERGMDRKIVAAFKEIWPLYCDEPVEIEIIYGNGPYGGYTGWDHEKGCHSVGIQGRFPQSRRMIRMLFHELAHVVKNAWQSCVYVTLDEMKAVVRGEHAAVERAEKAANLIPSVERDMTDWARKRTDEWYHEIIYAATDEPQWMREKIAHNWDDFAGVRKAAKRSLVGVDTSALEERKRRERRRQDGLKRAKAQLDKIRSM